MDMQAWQRFWRSRMTKLSVCVISVIIAVSLVTLPLSSKWYNVQELDSAVRHAPSFSPVIASQYFAEIDNVIKQPRGLKPAAQAAYRTTSWLGHDDLGRSLLFRLLPAFLVSLSIGLAAAGMAVVVGTAWGTVAAMFGGRVDMIMMRIVDVFYGLPYILTVILMKIALTRPLTALFGGHTKYADLIILFVAIGGVSWLTMARVIRGQVLSLRSQPYVEAARAIGAGPIRIIWRHLIPNLIGPIVTYATLVIPQAILQESFLSFLGIGVQQPTPSLGRLAADGVEAVNMFVGYWWLIVFPCALLLITLLSLNFIGDSLRDAFDPKSREATLV